MAYCLRKQCERIINVSGIVGLKTMARAKAHALEVARMMKWAGMVLRDVWVHHLSLRAPGWTPPKPTNSPLKDCSEEGAAEYFQAIRDGISGVCPILPSREMATKKRLRI
jgi:hypothetical protein